MSILRCILVASTLVWNASMAATPVLVMHGGAGVIRQDLTPEKEKLVRADLETALATGYAVLKSGGTSLDAVSKAIVVLEDSPRFNAGKGAVFTHDGRNELDAIDVCHGYVAAQRMYALVKHDGARVNQYAQRVISTPGKQDGLA